MYVLQAPHKIYNIYIYLVYTGPS